MKKISTYNTFPSKGHSYWQFIIIPTISLFSNKDEDENNVIIKKYFFIHFEWMFWSLTFKIK